MSAIVLRVAAGPGVGLGHISRCRALAEHFTEVTFVTGVDGVASLMGLGLGANRIVSIGPGEPVSSWLHRLSGGGAVVFDTLCSGHALATESEVAAVVRSGRAVAVIDSMPPDHFHGSEDATAQCDVVITPYLSADGLRARPRARQWLAGAQWSILPTAVIDARLKAFPIEPRILVACGGTDPGSLSLQVAKILGAGRAPVEIVIGPDFSDELVRALKDLAKKRSVLRLHHGIVDMLPFYLQATVVVGRPGLQRYEVAALGRMGIYFWDGEDYLNYFRNFASQGLAEFYFNADPCGLELFLKRVGELTNELFLRQVSRVNAVAFATIDGTGAAAVAKKILSVTEASA